MNVAAAVRPPAPRPVRRWVAAVSLAAALAAAAIAFPSALARFDPRAPSGPPAAAPDGVHRLGTNALGQDLFSQWLYGARTSLTIGVAVAALSTVLSGAGGTLAGVGGPSRGAVLAVIDGLLAIPHLPLIILIVSLIGPGWVTLVAVLALIGWPAYARVVRTQVQIVLRREYVEAARAAGARTLRIMRTCVLPEIAPILWTKFLLTMRWAILLEATLALLGLSDPARVSWGSMLSDAFAYPLLFVGNAWLWWALPPAVSIAAVTLALALLGREFETALNPARLTAPGASPRRPPRSSRRAAGWYRAASG